MYPTVVLNQIVSQIEDFSSLLKVIGNIDDPCVSSQETDPSQNSLSQVKFSFNCYLMKIWRYLY